MDVLWRGEATVAEITDHLDDPPLAYNTVLTTLRILETKGYVGHRNEGRAFVYRARVEREEARRSALRHVISTFFDGSPRALMLSLIESEKLGEDEAERIRALLARGPRAERPQ